MGERWPGGASRGGSATGAPTRRRWRSGLIVAGSVSLLGAVGLWAITLNDRQPGAVREALPRPVPPALRRAPEVARIARPRAPDVIAKMDSLCSSCHVLPTPDVEPRYLWPPKIEQMYRYMRDARPIPEDRIPPIEEMIEYWASRAPQHLPLPPEALAAPPSPVKFARRPVTLEAIPSFPAISCVRIVRWSDEGPPELLISDLRHGVVVLWTPTLPPSSARVIARIPHPSRTTVVDLDQDGHLDILVANMGVFGAVDTTEGSVVWLRNQGNNEFEQIVLQSGLGRVNNIQAADFDGDGQLDLLVAVFGNLTTGELLYLENGTTDWSEPYFEGTILEPNPGILDVPLVDLNDDGHLDFVIVQAQEHERIVGFLNRGRGSFYQELIYTAPHPRWGSVTISLADLQGNGRTDVLLAHGDALDEPPVIRPYHGITWLENTGTFPFTDHRLTHFPGAHAAIPVDVDGDGLLDIVSCAFIPAIHPWSPDAAALDSVIWLRQTAAGQFERYSVDTGILLHPCADAGDINGDGAVDIVVGNFLYFELEDLHWEPSLTIYESELKRGDR